MRYRPDIDGLRGIAVVAVLLRHANVPFFSGGFVGVDVFFVVSGFLITSLIEHETRAGRFSLISFYERRFRRLFPALFAVTLATLIVGAVLLLPNDFRSLCQSVVATSGFVANFLFWKTVGYFDAAADTKPLLHVWTLSVEEQFYIVFPATMMLAWRCVQARAYLFIAAVALISFVAAANGAYHWPTASFYLLPFRAWELLAGALIAILITSPARSRALREGTAVVGACLIAYSVIAFSDVTIFPGLNALYPALGTSCLIISGMSEGTLVNRLLSIRPLVFVGLISYSLYLWHWPILAFAKYFAIRDLSNTETLAVLAASGLVAAASWRFIECPFRGTNGLLSRSMLFRTSAAAITVFIAIGLAGHVGDGFSERLPENVVALATESQQPGSYRECFHRSTARIKTGDVCTLGDPSTQRPSFVVWGDSHALALAPVIDQLAVQTRRTGLLIGGSGCAPLVGVDRRARGNRFCPEMVDAMPSLFKRYADIRTIVLVGRWAFYTSGDKYGLEPYRTAVASDNERESNVLAFRDGLDRTLNLLAERKLEVIFITQAPEIGWNVPSVYARAQYFGMEIPIAPPTLSAYQKQQSAVMAIVRNAAKRYPMRIIDLSRALCPLDYCLVERNGRLLYRDSQHLTLQGAEVAAKALQGML